MTWFGVRTILQVSKGSVSNLYEERVTVWPAKDFDEAIGLAEKDSLDYAEQIGDAEYLGLAQAFDIGDHLQQGSEVFSLIRTSVLEPKQYLDRYFDDTAEVE